MDSTIFYNKNMVCLNPAGGGVHIDYMPDFFATDTMDNNKPHVHTFYEIIWFKEEGGIHTVDFQDYEIKKDMLIFLAPGQVHHFNGTKRNKGLTIKLCADFLTEGCNEEDTFINFDIFNSFNDKPYCTIEPEIAKELNKYIEEIESEKSHVREFGHSALMRALIKIILIYIHRHGINKDYESQKKTKASHRLFMKFRGLLEENYTHIHTVKEYADMLNVSSKTLSNSVLECSGQTPLEFINNRIIIESKRLLRFSDLMIKEIGYNMGYDDPSYFVKFFKRATGYLPFDFREGGQRTSIKQ